MKIAVRRTPSTSQNSNAEPSASLIKLVAATGTTKKSPIASAIEPAIVSAQVNPPIGLAGSPPSSASSWALAEIAERPKADFQRLAERDDTSDHRQAQNTVAVCPRDQRLGGDLDLAGCATEPGAAIGIDQVLGARLSNRNCPGRDPPHHHALEHRLTTDGGVAQCYRHAVGHARGVDLGGLGAHASGLSRACCAPGGA